MSFNDENLRPDNLEKGSGAVARKGPLPVGPVFLSEIPELSEHAEHLAKYKSMGVLAERIEGGYYRYELNGNKGLTKRAVLQGLEELPVPFNLVMRDGIFVPEQLDVSGLKACVVYMPAEQHMEEMNKIKFMVRRSRALTAGAFNHLKQFSARQSVMDECMDAATKFRIERSDKMILKEKAKPVFAEAAAIGKSKLLAGKKLVKKQKKERKKERAAADAAAVGSVSEPLVQEDESPGWEIVKNRKPFTRGGIKDIIYVPPMATPTKPLTDDNMFRGLPSKPSGESSLPSEGSSIVTASNLETIDIQAHTAIKLLHKRHTLLKHVFVASGMDIKKTYNLSRFLELAYKQGKPWSFARLASYSNDVNVDIEERVRLLVVRMFGSSA